MSLLTVEEFLQQSIQEKQDPEVIEILEDIGILVEDIRQFLDIDERTENREQYGTFWKRFMQHLMAKKIAEIPLVYAIMNPMRLILQNLKDPITVVDLKYENQFSGDTQVLDLTQVCFIDQKILSHYLSLNANTPNTNTWVQLMNSFEISIQQISSFRGVDVAMASILYDEVHDEHLDQSIAWVSCDHSPSVILDVNIDLLLLLTRELKYTYDIWKKVMSGKTPNIERQNVQVSKNLRDYVNDEGLLYVNLRGMGIAKVITSPHQEPIQLTYVYGCVSFLDIESKYVNNYDQYLKTHERRQSELLQQQQVQQSLQHASEIDDGSRRKKLKPFLTPPAVPKEAAVSSMPPPAPASTPGTSKTKAIAEQFSSPAATKRKEFVSPTGDPSARSHDNEDVADLKRNLSHSDDANHSNQPTKRDPISSPGIMNENLLDTPERGIAAELPHSNFASPIASNPATSSTPIARPGIAFNLDFEERDDMTLKERKELRKRREEYEKQRKLQEFLRVEGNTKDFLPSVSQDPRDPNSAATSSAPIEQNKGSGGGSNVRGRGSVKDRFVIAQLAQQEQENERLAKFKNDPNKRINTSGVSEVRSKWSETVNPDGSVSLYSASQDPYHHQASEGDEQRGQQKAKLRNKWEEALHETKNTEISRFQNRKLHTISQFRVTQGTGIVKKRIGEWEELFMQIAATAEQLEEFLRAAHALSEKNEYDGMTYEQILELQQQFLDSCQVAEDFVINDTHIYSSKVLSPIIHSYLKKALAENKTNHYSLSCGVYGETASKPPIDVFAAAIKTNQGKIYVALTVKAALGKDLDINVYGLKKVTVLGKDLQTNIFEKILNILPMPGWEAWIADGHYEEMRAIINYNKPSASRNTSFYDASTARVDGASHVLDDFDMIEEEDEGERGSVGEVEPSTKTDNTVIDNNASRKTDTSTIATQNEGEEEDLEDVDLGSSKKIDDEVANEPPPVPPIESMPSIDAAEVVDRSTSGAMPSHKRLSTGSTVSEYLPGDEGEGTWALTLTPTPDTPPRQNDGDLHPVITSLDEELNKPDEPRVLPDNLQAKDPRSSSVGAENDYYDERESSRQASHLRSDESQGYSGGVARAGGKVGEFSDDEDDDDETQGDENEEEGEDDNEEHYHFGKSPVLVSATVARSYLPSSTITTNFMRSKHNQSKFSWTIDSELEKRLDSASHDFTYLNLRDVKNSYCVSNFFIIQGSRNSAVFTGNLAHAMTDSVYILEGERVFEWIRGAAASGWCWKFPMQSQNFGRLRKRFFIIRDNVMSYHKIKPKHEDDIASAFSHNTLHLTDTSTVSIGRRRLQRCLIITTPLDTLWLKMSKDFTSEAVKWTNEITKAIQGFSRPKLIMTKARIESKWYHESPLFSLVNVDVVTGNMGSFGMNLSEEEHSSYCKVALFCLKINIHHTRQTKFNLSSNSLIADPDVEQDVCTYSVDIATNDTQRLQVEILNEDETINLSNRLSIVKVYGDYLLFGGNKGYLSLGVLSKTKPSTMLLSPPTSATPQGKGSGSNNVSTSKRVMFTIPLIDTLLETSVHYQNEKRKSSAAPAYDPNTSSGDGGSGAGGAMMLNYPHSTSADITAIAVACYNSIFAAADSSGVISLWYLPRNPKLGNLSVRSSISNPSGMKKLYKRLKLYVITVLNIKNCDAPFAQQTDTNKSLSKKKMQALLSGSGGVDGEITERIIKMKFLYQDSYLLVCTNRRMLLFCVQYQQSSMGFSAMMSQPSTVATSAFPQQSFEECYSRGTSMDFTSLQNNSALKSAFNASSHARPVRNVLGFSGWVELDRAVPRCYGIFDFFISEEYYDVLPNSGATSPTKQSGPSRKIVQWRAAEIDDEDEGKNLDKGSKLASKLKSLVPPSSTSSSSSEVLLRKCTVSRLQWTEAMFEAALAKLKPCPVYSPFD